MKAIVIEKPGKLCMKEVATPEPPVGFVRIKVKASAICATDLEVIDGNIPANYPLIPGHEWSGIVDKAGCSEDEHWVGKAVVGSNDVVCLKCDACRSGNWRYCKEFEEIGFRRNGAYAEYVVVPAYGLCEKPESVSFNQAALCEPLGVALGSLEKVGAKFGNTLTIIGAGSIGLCILAVAKAMGMRSIIVCAATQKRLSEAKEMGAYATFATKKSDIDAIDVIEEVKKIHEGGSDIVVEATGIEECVQNAFKMAKKGGSVALAGYGRGKIMNIRIDDIHINNLNVVGAGNNWNKHKRAITTMADGDINIERLVTETLRLEDYERGIELARKRPVGFIKGVFEFD